jgi:hypothetical protein
MHSPLKNINFCSILQNRHCLVLVLLIMMPDTQPNIYKQIPDIYVPLMQLHTPFVSKMN